MRWVIAALACAMVLLGSAGAHAQNALRITTCGTGSPPSGVSPLYMDASGNLCANTTGGAGAAVTPVVSGSLEASHVFKSSAGVLYSAYASNITGGTSGFLEIFNATSAPADGAVTPLVCVPISGGVASANYQGIPPASFSTGIVAVVSSSTTCFTKTTGVLTAFISGIVQ